MPHQVHIGRLSFTSPESLSIDSSPGGRSFSITGRFGGVENEMSHLKYLRDELASLAYCDEILPFRYDGDSTMNGYVKVTSASVNVSKYLLGSFSYNVQFEYLGREGDVMFESRLTGSILENSHSIVTGSEKYHVPPANHYAYLNPGASTSSIRTAGDLTTDSANDTVSLYLKQGANLRNYNAQYSVDTEDYYKGACQISMGTHTEKGNADTSTTTVNSIRNGTYAGEWSVGDSLILENGIIKVTLGVSTIKALFNTMIWDDSSYATEQEWAFSLGTPSSGNHLGEDYAGWRRVQILTNKPEICVVRATTYKENDKSGRLVVDFALRRGAHYVSIIANNYTGGTPLNISLSEDPSTNADYSNFSDGYLLDGTASPEDNNTWILGTPHEIEDSVTLMERGMIQKSVGGSTFSAMVGYVLRDSDTGNPLGHNDADSVFKQYIDNVNESQRIIKA